MASFQTQSRKLEEHWIGPFQIKTMLDISHYLLADWHGKLLLFFGTIYIHRLKPCYLNLGKVQKRFWQQSQMSED